MLTFMQKRKHILNELLTTERDYVRDMRSVMEVWNTIPYLKKRQGNRVVGIVLRVYHKLLSGLGKYLAQ